MNSRFIRALMIGAFFVAATAGAQTGGRTAPSAGAPELGKSLSSAHATSVYDSTRRYDAQALRFESHWGSADIIRGASDSVVATVGWFRSFDIEKMVASSPRAVTEAHAFETNNFRGSLVAALGGATLTAGILVASNMSNNASSPVLIIAGAGAVAWGLQHVSLSYAALARAMWWYNRDLSR
ncbi:MAG TPA: hypothetical protein VF887_06825 [Gemmatimonadaceae bacterium]